MRAKLAPQGRQATGVLRVREYVRPSFAFVLVSILLLGTLLSSTSSADPLGSVLRTSSHPRTAESNSSPTVAPGGHAPILTGKGHPSAVSTSPSEGWTLWSNTSNPPTRDQANLVDDPGDGGVLLFGGWIATPTGEIGFNDTWLFHAGQWTELCSGTSAAPACGKSPPVLIGARMAYDAAASEVVLFGGNGGSSTWIFHNGTWSQSGARIGSGGGDGLTMAYDPAVGAVVLFDRGGQTWTFANNTWTLEQPVASPPPTSSQAFFYTAATNGMILWGGDGGGGSTAHTWEYRDRNWTQLFPTVSPPAGYPFASGYDSAFGFGLVLNPTGSSPDNTTWTFASGGWTNATAGFGAAPPTHGGYPAFAYDSTDGYAVDLTGGVDWNSGNSTWLLRDPLVLNVTAPATVRDVGQPVTYPVTVLGGIQPYSVSYPGLPPGCTPPVIGSSNFAVRCLLRQAGTFSLAVNATDSFGPRVSVVLALHVNSAPALLVTATQNPTTVGIPVRLEGIVSGGTPPANVSWTVAGRLAANSSLVVQSFSAPGPVLAVFTAVDAAGDRVTSNLTIAVNSAPSVVAQVSQSVTDVGIPVNFTAMSSGGTSPLSFAWLFGDGGRASTNVTAHAFAAAGAYDVQEWNNDSVGSSASTSVLVRVNPALEVNASTNVSAPGVGATIGFTALAAGGTPPLSFRWDFGDGRSSSSPNSALAYSSPGPHAPTLTVTDAAGASRTVRLSVDVVAPSTHHPTAPPAPSGSWGLLEPHLLGAVALAGIVGLVAGVVLGRGRLRSRKKK
jgi:PKD domain-containing protein